MGKRSEIQLLQERAESMERQITIMREKLRNVRGLCAADVRLITKAATLCHQAALIIGEHARRAEAGALEFKVYRDAAGWDLTSASALLVRADLLLNEYMEGQAVLVRKRQPNLQDASLQFSESQPEPETLAGPGPEADGPGEVRPGKGGEGGWYR